MTDEFDDEMRKLLGQGEKPANFNVDDAIYAMKKNIDDLEDRLASLSNMLVRMNETQRSDAKALFKHTLYIHFPVWAMLGLMIRHWGLF